MSVIITTVVLKGNILSNEEIIILEVNTNPATYCSMARFKVGDICRIISRNRDKIGLFMNPTSLTMGTIVEIISVLSELGKDDTYVSLSYQWDYEVKIVNSSQIRFTIEANLEYYEEDVLE